MATRSIVFLFFILSIFLGCTQSKDEETQTKLPPGGSVTLWTSTTELFMEYPMLVVGKEARFAVHLSWLSNFKAVTEGSLYLVFTSAGRDRQTAAVDHPASPGIFRPTITFTKPGVYTLTMILEGVSTDTIRVEGLNVYSSLSDAPPDEEPSTGEQLVTFLKEQQWKIDFRTEPAKRKPFSNSVRSVAEIIPKLNSEAVISAPFTGIIPVELNDLIPVIGKNVMKGDRLVTMIPSAETPSGIENFSSRYIDAETDFSLAGKEFERAKRLREIEAISEKEYQETESEYKRAEATFKTLSMYAQSDEDKPSLGMFTLRAPLSGTVTEVNIVQGKQIDAGEELFRIIDIHSVWVRANVASTEIGKISTPTTAWLQLTGSEKYLEISEQNGKLISVATSIDPLSRTFPIVFEVKNPSGALRIGMFGEISIATGEEKNSIVIPESALLEDEGRYSVYVHVEGEAFAKRDVSLGNRNGEYVEILNGLIEGERVVTVGAYQVRLASLSSQLPAHGHEH